MKYGWKMILNFTVVGGRKMGSKSIRGLYIQAFIILLKSEAVLTMGMFLNRHLQDWVQG